MGKRANGEGTISRYRNGWRARLSLGNDSYGKRIRKSFYGKTQKEVREQMEQYKLDNKLITYSGDMTVDVWTKTWIYEYKINEIRSSSIERYSVIYKNYIRGTSLGRIKINELKRTDIIFYYNKLRKDGKADSIVKSVHKLLRAALNDARKNNYINVNYCSDITVSKKDLSRRTSDVVFTLDEEKRLLEFIKGNKYEMTIVLALSTGLRSGELVALRWEDIDLKEGTVSVNKGVSKTYYDKDGKRAFYLSETAPKTKSSIRSVPIPKSVLEQLIRYKNTQDFNKTMYKEIYKDNHFVLANEIGEPLKPDTILKAYGKILKDAGVSYKKFHALRHTYATRLSENGVSMVVAQKLLGHASIRMTAEVYTHVMENEKVLAVNKINNIFE